MSEIDAVAKIVLIRRGKDAIVRLLLEDNTAVDLDILMMKTGLGLSTLKHCMNELGIVVHCGRFYMTEPYYSQYMEQSKLYASIKQQLISSELLLAEDIHGKSYETVDIKTA